MPGTTRQIFDQLQGSNGIVSPTPIKVDTVESKWAAIASQWTEIKTIAGVDGLAYLNSKGLTDAFIATVTADAATKSSVEETKQIALQSQKEFSPRMMVCDSYTSARERLQDTDLGSEVYNRMFEIHATTLTNIYDDDVIKSDIVISAGTTLKTALQAHPIPPGTPPVVDPSVDAAIITYKSALDTLKIANDNLKVQTDSANNADTNIMSEYLKYISNANLAKVLPEWYLNPDKTNTINMLASEDLIALIS